MKTPTKPRVEKSPDEVKICGIRAVHSLADHRIQDVIRVYVNEKQLKPFSQLLKWCAENRKAYHVVTDEDLEKISATVHHEGVCVLAKRRPAPTFAKFVTQMLATKHGVCVVYLDGVQNPHNVGAVLRTCAHFGIRYLLADKAKFPELSPSVYRTAEGGAEHVEILPVSSPIDALKELKKAGFALAATADKGNTDLYKWKMPDRVVFMMGSESYGLSKPMLTLADKSLAIPSSGAVESLNVSCATAVVLAEYRRSYGI